MEDGAGQGCNCIREKTLDDLMHAAIEEIQRRGVATTPTRGAASELFGVLLELTDPRARLSRTESRGKLFSCLGELSWYLARSNAAEFISYYLPRYRKDAEGDILHGAYGPRLFQFREQNQLANVIALLRRKPESRRAVVQLFDCLDLAEPHKEVPCTCSLQFIIRGGALHMFVSMRSNDVFLGLPHDVFCFTMIQELVARTLSVDVGSYKHAVGSFHLYDENRDDARDFIDEGWQATDQPMPMMPIGDPWPAVERFVALEAAIRAGRHIQTHEYSALDPYWADLVRLLQVFALAKARDSESIRELLAQMSSAVFTTFIQARLDALSHSH